ncbi:hypothetical protein CF327_g6054 [Tilletia walkeri]|uniref:Cyclin N-terminal domain-containing protein n=1 Tax=Tilletia walkeri TaxID=117179 RepID=A0A8X7N9C7_9BASI|nr:hypothetical protein CF327_g6054 [Tilletia walkeri]KAE8268035.1 hypothetical protein A4X09_0g4312 [Tilletia walkeri]
MPATTKSTERSSVQDLNAPSSSSSAGQKRKSASSPLEGAMQRRSSNPSCVQQMKRSSRNNLQKSSTQSSLNMATTPTGGHAQSAVSAATSIRNMLLEEEYQEEAISHMHSIEASTLPNIELMDVQPELRWYMRPFLVDFLIEIHQTFRLRPETLYLTMNIVDRYVSKRIVYKRHYQLVGCAALLIAAKYEDAKNHIPAVQDLSQTCCNAYDETAFTQMEGHVLSTIGWQLGYPTPEAWLRIACSQIREEVKVQSVARFLMETTLFHKDFVSASPSALAGGALMLARHICGERTKRPEFDSEAICKAAQSIDSHMSENAKELSQILIKKYSGSSHFNASKLATEWYAKQNGAADENQRSSMGVLGHLQQCKIERSTTPEPSSASSHGSATGDDDESMTSSPATPSSISTMSSRSGHGDEDDDDEDDDDDDMPVTPLSLYSLHDPLAAAAASIEPASGVSKAHGRTEKENKMQRPDLCDKQANGIGHHHSQPPTVIEAGSRPALRTATWDCNMQL